MIRRPPRSTQSRSSAASDVYKRQAWLHMDESGQIWAINPEAGYFGVVPGTNEDDNENAYKAIQSDAIFTNVGLTDNNEPWWEGRKDGNPVIDWRGNEIEQGEDAVFAHPNSRFTVSAKNNPKYSDLADSSNGVPISAICLLYTSPSPRDRTRSRMPSSA